jgi:hypothetical protein
MDMVANAERMDREQEERARGQIGEALVGPCSVMSLDYEKLISDAR